MDQDAVIVVSGLPRSGTSMMMQMLEAGGVEILTDGQRTADGNNPRGYYEFERVKKLPGDQAWVVQAVGKAVKVVSPLLAQLPAEYRYRVIFMERPMAEVLASQQAMLERLGATESADIEDAVMAERFGAHLEEVKAWMASSENVEVLYVAYTDAVEDPQACAGAVAAFLGGQLDTAAMAAVGDRSLYRQRHR